MATPLTAGTKFGRYEILSLIGAGGMGEVYRARDVKLNRDVAMKILPEALSGNASRLHRFEQEAQAAGALNHPNILAVYDVGAHDGAPYVISELLEGETLRQILAGGELPQRKAVDYALRIAYGLAAAHDKGIIHRDLKPDNIFVTRDEQVKILDFGLAKLLQPAPDEVVRTDLDTLKVQTEPGTVLGTAGYMAPEQVRGQRVDHRSDIFSFGAVLYELLTGKQAFDGDSAVERLNAILKNEPPEISQPNSRINPSLERIVRRCLEKKPERRFHSAHDLSFALEALSGSSESWLKTEPAQVTSQSQGGSTSLFGRRWVAWLVAGVFGLLTVMLAWLHFARPATGEARTVRLSILPPEKTFLMAGQPPLISPDGKILAFVAMDASGKSLLYVRPLDSTSARSLDGSDGAVLPFWSPDSRSLGFFAGGKLKKAEVSGGQPTTLASAPNPRGGAWSRDGVIIYCPVPPSPLLRISASGGESTPINTVRIEQGKLPRWLPHFLPDGSHYLFLSRVKSGLREIRLGTLDSDDSKLVVNAQSNAVYTSQGYLLFRRETSLIAQGFDLTKLELSGEPVAIADGVGFDATSYQGFFSASNNGIVVHHTGGAGRTQLTWMDRTGKQLGTVGELADQGDLQLSWDDTRLAFRRVDFQSGNISIWLMELARGEAGRFTFEQTYDFAPIWSPDGSRIVFGSLRDGAPNLYQKVSSSAGNDEPLLKSFIPKLPQDWSADGRFIAYEVIDPKTSWDLWVLPLDDISKAAPFLQTDYDEREAQFSPNGRWIAYVSNESGRNEVYVRPFPVAPGKWQLTTSGGDQPRWRRDGKELFYLSADHKLMSIETRPEGSTFEHSAPNALFVTRVGGVDTPGHYYAVTADGQRFILNNLVAEAAYTPITVVLNWTSELKN